MWLFDSQVEIPIPVPILTISSSISTGFPLENGNSNSRRKSVDGRMSAVARLLSWCLRLLMDRQLRRGGEEREEWRLTASMTMTINAECWVVSAVWYMWLARVIRMDHQRVAQQAVSTVVGSYKIQESIRPGKDKLERHSQETPTWSGLTWDEAEAAALKRRKWRPANAFTWTWAESRSRSKTCCYVWSVEARGLNFVSLLMLLFHIIISSTV